MGHRLIASRTGTGGRRGIGVMGAHFKADRESVRGIICWRCDPEDGVLAGAVPRGRELAIVILLGANVIPRRTTVTSMTPCTVLPLKKSFGTLSTETPVPIFLYAPPCCSISTSTSRTTIVSMSFWVTIVAGSTQHVN